MAYVPLTIFLGSLSSLPLVTRLESAAATYPSQATAGTYAGCVDEKKKLSLLLATPRSALLLLHFDSNFLLEGGSGWKRVIGSCGAFTCHRGEYCGGYL